MREQPVNPRDAHIVESSDGVCEEFGSDCGFFRDRYIGGAAACDNDASAAVGFRNFTDDSYARFSAVIDIEICYFRKLFAGGFVQSRYKYRFLSVPDQRIDNTLYL